MRWTTEEMQEWRRLLIKTINELKVDRHNLKRGEMANVCKISMMYMPKHCRRPPDLTQSKKYIMELKDEAFKIEQKPIEIIQESVKQISAVAKEDTLMEIVLEELAATRKLNLEMNKTLQEISMMLYKAQNPTVALDGVTNEQRIKLPKIAVIGLLPVQGEKVKSEFKNLFEIKILDIDKNPRCGTFANFDFVVVVTKFINHSVFGEVQLACERHKVIKIMVNGGVTSVINSIKENIH